MLSILRCTSNFVAPCLRSQNVIDQKTYWIHHIACDNKCIIIRLHYTSIPCNVLWPGMLCWYLAYCARQSPWNSASKSSVFCSARMDNPASRNGKFCKDSAICCQFFWQLAFKMADSATIWTVITNSAMKQQILQFSAKFCSNDAEFSGDRYVL